MSKQGIDLTTKVRISEEPNRYAKAILEDACEQVLSIGVLRARLIWGEGLPAWTGRRGA